jgi:eukaryotic-like serine/threonine-protein kinase
MERRWIWPFELLEKLGEGGMGVVYRARYVKNDKIVAVKLLPPSITDETLLARFEREMQLLRTLRHPHIVHTFGGKCEGDQRFYAMELIEGGNIDDLLQEKKRLSVDTTVSYALQMCSGLAYAHDKGITHRDIKPGNFLLTKDGTLKLADFGLATVAASNKLTATGKTMGTFRYMAPEQIRGKPDPCPQTDIYALGVVLFEMLTGEVPFDAETPAEVLHKHLKTPPPRLSALVPSVPKPLDDLIDRMLKKRIEDRPASAVEVGVALKSLDEAIHVSERRTVETTSPPTEAERIVIPAPFTDAAARIGGVPRWAVAIPAVIALLALYWGWSRGDEVAALERVESFWVQKMLTGTPPEKVFAAQTLGEIGAAGDDTLKSLQAGMSDPEPTVRIAAVNALGHMGEDAQDVAFDIRKLVQKDDRQEVRAAAADAFFKITGNRADGGASAL